MNFPSLSALSSIFSLCRLRVTVTSAPGVVLQGMDTTVLCCSTIPLVKKAGSVTFADVGKASDTAAVASRVLNLVFMVFL